MSDSYSIRSEGSSDSSDNFLVIHEHAENNHQDILGVFKPKGTAGSSAAPPAESSGVEETITEDLEVAVEVRADTPTNSDQSSAGPPTTASFVSTRSREVAVVTFHINDLELIQQSVGSASSVRLQAGHLSCNECAAISNEEFQVYRRCFMSSGLRLGL